MHLTYMALRGNPGGEVPVLIAQLKALKKQDATELCYRDLNFDDAVGVQLCEALRYAHAHGGLTKVKTLDLERNELGDGFITSFVALLDEGGLAGVEKLVLSRNAISEQGMQELAAAVTRGGLPSCTILYLDNNPGSGKRGYRKVGEALKQRKK